MGRPSKIDLFKLCGWVNCTYVGRECHMRSLKHPLQIFDKFINENGFKKEDKKVNRN